MTHTTPISTFLVQEKIFEISNIAIISVSTNYIQGMTWLELPPPPPIAHYPSAYLVVLLVSLWSSCRTPWLLLMLWTVTLGAASRPSLRRMSTWKYRELHIIFYVLQHRGLRISLQTNSPTINTNQQIASTDYEMNLFCKTLADNSMFGWTLNIKWNFSIYRLKQNYLSGLYPPWLK